MLSHRDFLLHPTSMQSLVSSSAGGGSRGGASNPGLRIADSSHHEEDEIEEDSVYCDLTRPTNHNNDNITDSSWNQQNSASNSTRRERLIINTTIPTPAATKRVKCLRIGLFVAFIQIVLGVVVTSAYAIDKCLSQMPQLLYVGLGLCSIGLCLIVVCISLLVVTQLGKQQHHRQRHRQRRQSAAARRSASSRQLDATSAQRDRVPIWYIGCHRDTATAYCPPVPPSYWDSTNTASASTPAAAAPGNSSPKLQPQRQSLHPPPPPPPAQQPSRLQRELPQPPPSPPSYQEALRCLEQRSQARPPPRLQPTYSRRQPTLTSSDEMAVLKWTVQSQYQHQLHHQRQQQQQQQHQQLSIYPRQNSAESSSFIGEPILV